MHARSRFLVSLAANEAVSVCQLYEGLKANSFDFIRMCTVMNWQEDVSLWGKKLKHIFY